MDGTTRILVGENQMKLWCPSCERHRSYSRFPTSYKTESGREAVCSDCKNNIKPKVSSATCVLCGRS